MKKRPDWLAAVVALSFMMVSASPAAISPDRTTAIRVANLLELVSAEYNLGVRDGKIIDPAEYLESQLFMDQTIEVSQTLTFIHEIAPGLAALKGRILERKPGTEILAGIQDVLNQLDKKVALPELALPAGVSIAEGEQIFKADCATCHGPPPRKIDNVPPPDFSDPDFLRSRNPLQLYTAVTEGVKDTPMPSWLDSLDDRQRWSVVYYSYTLAFPVQSVDDGRRKFVALPVTTQNRISGGGNRQKRSMEDIGDKLEGTTPLTPRDRDDIEFYVLNLPRLESEAAGGNTALSHTIEQVIRGLQDVKTLVDSGKSGAARRKLADAYTQFERIEPLLATTKEGSQLVKQTEASFMQLQGSVQNPKGFIPALRSLQGMMETHRSALAEKLTAPAAFSQAFIILLREGFEAFLILTAITGFLVKV
ncbi:MAG: c-type cytochrome, partial [bacterium]